MMLGKWLQNLVSGAKFPLAAERFGVTGGGTLSKWDKYGAAGKRFMEEDVAILKAAGVKWVRVGMSPTEPVAAGVDRCVRLLRERGIQVLGYFSMHGTPTDEKAFRARVKRLVRAYPFITVWETGNEPNLTSYWKSPLEEYVPTLKSVYESVKEVGGERQVSCAGLSEWKVEPFLEMMMRQEAGKWMDIFAFHPYNGNPQRVLGRVEAAKKLIKDSAMGQKPVWITEIGFHTAKNWKNNAGHVEDEAVKAQYLEQTLALLATATQGPVFWYTSQEKFAGETLGYGLFNRVIMDEKEPLKGNRVVYSAAYARYKQLSGG